MDFHPILCLFDSEGTGAWLVIGFCSSLRDGVWLVWKAVMPNIRQPSIDYTLGVRGRRFCRLRCPDCGAAFYTAAPAPWDLHGGVVPLRHRLTLFWAANRYNAGRKKVIGNKVIGNKRWPALERCQYLLERHWQ